MKFLAIVALFISLVIAVPTEEGVTLTRRDSGCGGGLYSNPQCCGATVLGLASLDCSSPKDIPTSDKTLASICQKEAKSGKCCAIPVANIGVLCTDSAPKK